MEDGVTGTEGGATATTEGATGAEGGGNWFDTLSEDVRTPENLPTFQKFKDVNGLAKSYVEAQKMISRKGVIIPTEKSTPDEVARYRHEMGIPEKADLYGLKKPDKLPDGVPYNEERTKAFADLAHKLNIPKAAVEQIHNWWNENEVKGYESAVKAASDFREKTTAELKTLWGNNFEANLKKADEIITPVFGQDFQKMLVETGLNMHPAMIKGLYKIAESMGEHAFAKAGGNTVSQKTLADKRSELNKIISDPGYANPSMRKPGEDLNAKALKVAQEIADMEKDLTAGAA